LCYLVKIELRQLADRTDAEASGSDGLDDRVPVGDAGSHTR
jgi:hypothetical protein